MIRSVSRSVLIPNNVIDYVNHIHAICKPKPAVQTDLLMKKEHASAIQCYGDKQVIILGKLAHARCLVYGQERSRYLANFLVEMYGKCASLEDACIVFNRIYQPNLFSWNIMIAACGRCGSLEGAWMAFSGMSDHDLVSWNALLGACAQCGSVRDTLQVFNKMPRRDVVSWTTMIAAFVQKGDDHLAIHHFQQMQLENVIPNKVTYLTILNAYRDISCLTDGKRLHEIISAEGLDTDVVVANALITMYGKCRSLNDAKGIFHQISHPSTDTWNAILAACAQCENLDETRKIFSHMPQPDIVSWTTIIAAHAQNGHCSEAFNLFWKMQHTNICPNRVTYLAILDGLFGSEALANGKLVHCCILYSISYIDLQLGNAIINMYGKSGSLNDAQLIFEQMPSHNIVSWNAMLAACVEFRNLELTYAVFNTMPEHNVVSWTSIIAAHAQGSHSSKAIQLFKEMQLKGIIANKVTCLAVLDACAGIANLYEGKKIHDFVVQKGFQYDIAIGNALIIMYGKCGSVKDAKAVFDNMLNHDSLSWNSMLTTYTHSGYDNEAFYLFPQMQLEGTMPNEVTLLNMLYACSHVGLVNEGCQYFASASQSYFCTITKEHYHCMVDILGRAGKLDEAEDLMMNLELETVNTAYSSLISACRIYGGLT